jgi:exonuclease SbcC
LKTECEGKARAARQQAENYGRQKATKAETAQNLHTQIAGDQKGILDTKADFQQSETITADAKKSWAACEHWLGTTRSQIDSNLELIAEILEGWTKIESWKPESLSRARAQEEEFDKAAKALAKNLAEAEKLKETLAEQLEQIGGGVCPFLKEKCRQFDPKKIQSDVATRQEEINRLTNRHTEATAAHRQAKALVEKLAKEEAELAQLRNLIEHKVELFIKAHNKLFSIAVQQHFAVLGGYLPEHAAWLSIQPLANATAGGCYDKFGALLDTRAMTGLAAAEAQFHAQAAGIFASIAEDMEKEIKSFEGRRDERLGKERDLKNRQRNLHEIEGEIKELTASIAAQDNLGRKADEEAGAAGKSVTEFDEKLKAYSNVERGLEEQRILKDQNTDGHAKHLGAKPSADRLDQRQQALRASSDAETRVVEQVRQKQTTFDQVQREFDPAAVDVARQKSEEAARNLATESAHLEGAKRELGRQRVRFAEWQAATREQEAVLIACGKLQACIELTQKARHILQKAAPMVAQHVCRRIAARAQQIFNQINTEPVELDWNSERYSLRITPGERRFAMLSGGEQTKLALAMTLAMIQEFCGLKFCIFDEPTYAVDADSRHKLADAIVRLQDVTESRLDQLLLVSHDDAFEGKIEHVVMIRKTATEGSAPLLTT